MLLNPDQYLQSISSKHIPCTDTKPNRIKTTASCGNSRIVSYDIELEYPDSHIKALIDHAQELQWLDKNDYAIGSIKEGYILVLIPKQD